MIRKAILILFTLAAMATEVVWLGSRRAEANQFRGELRAQADTV